MASIFARFSWRVRIVDDQHLGAQALGRGLVLALPLPVDVEHAEPTGKRGGNFAIQKAAPIRFAHSLLGMDRPDRGRNRAWYRPSPWCRPGWAGSPCKSRRSCSPVEVNSACAHSPTKASARSGANRTQTDVAFKLLRRDQKSTFLLQLRARKPRYPLILRAAGLGSG